MMVAVGTNSCSSSSRFGPSSTFKLVTPVRLPPGRFRLATSPSCDRVAADREDDRNRRGRRLCRQCRRSTADGDDHAHLTADQIGRQRRQSIVLALRPAIFDRHILALDIAGFFQALAERGQRCGVLVRRYAAEEPDHRHRRLLRPRRKRPGRRAAEKRDEIAPLHSITSSARASSVGGQLRPSALAVLRLMTSSNLVGCRTGRSAGFSPLRMRPA